MAGNSEITGTYYPPGTPPPITATPRSDLPEVSNPYPTIPGTIPITSSDGVVELQTLLTEWGLSNLMPLVKELLAKEATPDEILLAIHDSPEFAERYPGIAKIREYNKAHPEDRRPVPSVRTYNEYERTVTGLFHAGGLSALATPEQIGELIANQVSASEVSMRIQNAYVEVQNAPQEVKDAFAEIFGPDSDAVLAGYILDPVRIEPEIEQQIKVAKVVGYGRIAGISVTPELATRGVETGITPTDFKRTFDRLNAVRSIFNETISEQTDLTAGQEGVTAQLGLDSGQAQEAIQRRVQQRQAAFGGGGGALVDRGGTGV